MKKFNIIFLLVFLFSGLLCLEPYIIRKPINAEFKFTVIGAGPAGIATIGVLLQSGVNPRDIIWIDPEFNMGRIGKYYELVPGNTKNKLFIEFIECCDAFKDCKSAKIDNLKSCNPEKEDILKHVSEALKAVTQFLSKKVHTINGCLKSLYFDKGVWNISTDYIQLTSKNVILATGSYPRSLNYDNSKEIPLDFALDPNKLKQIVKEEDTVLVVGSSHSAILLLKYLSEINVKKIINLYKNDLKYAIDMGTWVLYNSTGLKGLTAKWAKEILEKNPPKNLERKKNTKENLDKALNESTKIIYAIGYDKNSLPKISANPEYNYDDTTGIIAPGLFGIGIAFPEKYIDPIGNVEHQVGLNSFMNYAQRVVPQWINSNKKNKDINSNCFDKFENLFDINIL